MNISSLEWAVAIIAAREAPSTLVNCIRAAIRACGSRPAVIDVLVNGNPGLADTVRQRAWDADLQNTAVEIRIWSIALGDKAHAWNEYVHRIWPEGRHAFFLDGYAEPEPTSFEALCARFDENGDVLGATGVPSCGRSAQALREGFIKNGGLHGNMHAIRAEAMTKLRHDQCRLPLGLYRTDSLIGAFLMYRLDPANNKWDTKRIAVEPNATWRVADIARLDLKNLVDQFKRRLRQAQGDLENRATREHLAIKRLAPNTLAPTTHELVMHWADEKPHDLRAMLLRRPARLYAMRKLRQPRDWSAAEQLPQLLAHVGTEINLT